MRESSEYLNNFSCRAARIKCLHLTANSMMRKKIKRKRKKDSCALPLALFV
jgi:hypothetical protein